MRFRAEADALSADELAIRAVLDDRAAAVQDRDAARFVSYYDPSAVVFGIAPPLMVSGPAVLDPAALVAWFAGWEGTLEYQTRDTTVAVGDTVAFCHGLYRLRGVRVGGDRVELWARLTVGLRRVGDAWRITHEHNSTPFYMDGSGRAALDLAP